MPHTYYVASPAGTWRALTAQERKLLLTDEKRRAAIYAESDRQREEGLQEYGVDLCHTLIPPQLWQDKIRYSPNKLSSSVKARTKHHWIFGLRHPDTTLYRRVPSCEIALLRLERKNHLVADIELASDEGTRHVILAPDTWEGILDPERSSKKLNKFPAIHDNDFAESIRRRFLSQRGKPSLGTSCGTRASLRNEHSVQHLALEAKIEENRQRLVARRAEAEREADREAKVQREREDFLYRKAALIVKQQNPAAPLLHPERLSEWAALVQEHKFLSLDEAAEAACSFVGELVSRWDIFHAFSLLGVTTKYQDNRERTIGKSSDDLLLGVLNAVAPEDDRCVREIFHSASSLQGTGDVVAHIEAEYEGRVL